MNADRRCRRALRRHLAGEPSKLVRTPEREDNPLAPARGFAPAMTIGAGMWAAIALVVWWVTR